MNVLTSVSSEPKNLGRLFNYFIIQEYAKGECIFQQGEFAEGCFYILSGEVASEYYDVELDTQISIEQHQGGNLIGAMGLVGGEYRSSSAFALTNSQVLYLSAKTLETIKQTDIPAHQEFLVLFNDSLMQRVKKNRPIVQQLALTNTNIPSVDEQLRLAGIAHNEFLAWEESRVDSIIEDIAKTIYRDAEELATLTQLESGMGIVAHKILKIKLGSLDVADSLLNKPGNGSIELEANGIERVTMPVGIVFGMIPITNPVETIVFKTLISLKSRNAIIISSHRKGRNVGQRTVELIRQTLLKHGAPQDLVQIPQLESNRKLTNAYMTHKDMSLILATGGPSMVKSAYSSGTPAIGVGKGNAPVWVCDDCDIDMAVHKIVNSKAFDNGVVCGSENNLILDCAIADQFLSQAELYGAAVLNDLERDYLLNSVFAAGSALQAEFIGQSAADICLRAGIQRDYPIKLILVEAAAYDFSSVLLREKLAPILSFVRNLDEKMALTHAYEILELEGKGHTAIIHTQDQKKIRAFSAVVQVSRILVSTAGTQGCIGADNGLNLSWTLGCGTMGGGSVSDNVSYQHLQNSKRIAY